MSFDRTARTARGRLYQSIVRRYRRPRRTPREDAPGVWEDPAPDWVWKLVEAILEHTRRESDHGQFWVEQALAWCQAGGEEGDPVARSARIVALIEMPLGPPPLSRLQAFFEHAWRDTHVA